MGDWQTLMFRNKLLLIMSIVIIVVAGVAAFLTIPKLEDPVIVNRYAVVITQFPGATAERVESTITERIENTIQEISEVKELNSSSRPGISVVNIELVAEVTDPDPVWSKIRDRLRRTEAFLPTGASRPLLDEERGYAFTKLIAIKGVDQSVKAYTLARFANELKRRLQRFPGTDLVRLYGSSDEEVLVDVNIDKLNALGLSMQGLSQRIRSADAKLPAGQVYHPSKNIPVEMRGEFLSLDRIKRIPIAHRDGQIVTLSQIADIERSLRDPPSNLAKVDGKTAIVVAVRILPKQKIDAWALGVENILAQFQKELPANITAKEFFDQNDYTTYRLFNLRNSLLLGVTLVALVLLVTLGSRAALIVSLTLPMVLLSAIAMLNGFGYELHQISIIGLIVALGLVVDNAIVMVSAIQRRLHSGANSIDAIHQVVGHYWVPLLSSTVTTILAFMPIMLLTGDMGEFVSPMAASVIFSLLASYVISIVIVPSVAGMMLSQRHVSSTWIDRGVQLPRLRHKFSDLIGWSLTHRRATLSFSLIVPLVGFFCISQLVNQFFPRTDRNQFFIELYLPQQSAIAQTEALTKKLTPIIQSIPEVSSVQWFIGQSAPVYYYNRIANRDGSPHFAEALINTRTIEDVNVVIPKLQQVANEQFPEAQIVVRPLWQGPPFNAPVEVRLFGDDVDRLYAIGNELRVILQDLPGVTQTRNSVTFGAPKINLAADEDKLKILGITLNDLAQDMSRQFDGVISGSLLQGPEELQVRVRAHAKYRSAFQSVDDYYYNDGTQSSAYELGVPFSAIGEASYQPAVANISRLDGERVNIINGYVEPTVLPQAVLDDFRAQLKAIDYQLPYGYRLAYGGEEKERGEAVSNLLARVGLIIILMLATLVLTFNSVRYMSIIMVVALMSACFGLISLYVMNYPFGFVVIMALMGLIGVAINAGIIIISNLQRDPKAIGGRLSSVRRVIMDESSRHIVSTALTTIFGFAPLLFTPGDLWVPFAITFIGGIGLTTLVSFFVVPVLYEFFTARSMNSTKEI